MLMNYIDQMADAPNDVVKGALKDKRDERSTVIESLQERVDTLKAEEDKAKASEQLVRFRHSLKRERQSTS
jgi:hypothetical protein